MSCLLESRTESASPGSEDNIAITIATIAADLGRQVRAPFAGDETERGYYVSSYFLLNSMVEHGILSISPDKSHIVISKDLDRIDRYITYLQETHGKFHARDPVTLEHIRQSTPSADTTRFIDLLR